MTRRCGTVPDTVRSSTGSPTIPRNVLFLYRFQDGDAAQTARLCLLFHIRYLPRIPAVPRHESCRFLSVHRHNGPDVRNTVTSRLVPGHRPGIRLFPATRSSRSHRRTWKPRDNIRVISGQPSDRSLHGPGCRRMSAHPSSHSYR